MAFLALKKTGFSEIKNSSPQKIKKNLPFFYATFQCGRYNVFNFFFLTTKSWKNLPQKLLIIGPNLFSHSPAQHTANSPKSIFHIIEMSHQASVLLFVEKMHPFYHFYMENWLDKINNPDSLIFDRWFFFWIRPQTQFFK